METTQDNIALIPLTAVQRIKARQNAAQAVIALAGEPPQRSTFDRETLSDFPRWFTGCVWFMLGLVFIAAANMSLLRLFNIGRDHYLEDINDNAQAAVVGLSLFVMAEFMVIAATVTMEVQKVHGWKRFVLVGMIALGLAVALVGNWTFVEPSTAFGVLETFVPPFAALGGAVIMEGQIMEAVRQRRAANNAYEAAYAGYKLATSQPDKHEDFLRFYATELRDELYKTNKRAKKRKSYMDGLTDAEWSGLVRETMKADEWYKGAVHSLDTVNEQRTAQLDHHVHHSFTERTNERTPQTHIQPVHSANERMNEYAFTPPDSVHSLNGNGHRERTANAGYRKTMNARDYAREYFADPRHAGHIDHSLDALEKEISTWAGVKVGRTTIHNVRKELEQAMVS